MRQQPCHENCHTVLLDPTLAAFHSEWFGLSCRLKGELKVALRRVIERYELPVIITANQNIILTEIEPSWKSDILNTLHGAGVR